ncbi:YqeG family HAD IIIA-type phosphatase [Sporosarcina sp. PTS2304]|uniref:YqeG family HAD IIIA-type phosphatase n=1 Tax=Sporosarcina sp. PTS2304 TaxID=2283194 RepID=UPI000E0CC190|nr:YqeG family HAD IIIA-type phosphatase [Sporosarcina sp. PTS2304]AXH98945.1 YqeG family HAD IIIA-type phosphatase [Sporosarcina sp. PTS2304]
MLKQFLPSAYVKSVLLIKPETLVENGIKGIITDLDNTLVEWDRADATEDIMAWFESMRVAGLQVAVVSNNNIERVRHFCDPLGIPYICEARKPMTRSFHQAVATLGLPKEQVVMIGDQLLTDVLGANRAGMQVILVVPVASSDAPITKFNRAIERRIMARFKRKGLLTWED